VSAAPDPDTLAQLALQDLQNGQVAAAESKCLQALAVKGRHPRALSVLGVILHSRGRDEDAVRVFNALTQFEPTPASQAVSIRSWIARAPSSGFGPPSGIAIAMQSGAPAT